MTEVATEVLSRWKEKHRFESMVEIKMYSPIKFQLEVAEGQIRREDEEVKSL